MDEVKRFMRYVLPGMVFMTELLSYFAFSHGKRTIIWLHSVTSGDTVECQESFCECFGKELCGVSYGKQTVTGKLLVERGVTYEKRDY